MIYLLRRGLRQAATAGELDVDRDIAGIRAALYDLAEVNWTG